jgi:hypothetical protein
MTATETRTGTYDLAGRLLEVCDCGVLCPCWVGEDPDGGTCDSVMAWYVDRGVIEGVDVSDRGVAFNVHIPGNILAGNWRTVLFVDDRCTDEQHTALRQVFTGELGGPIADLTVLIGEVVAVERAPMTFTVQGGRGVLTIGDKVEARLSPFQGATGGTTTLQDTVFSTIPGSPVYPGKAELFRRAGGHGLSSVELTGRNAIQGSFRFTAT